MMTKCNNLSMEEYLEFIASRSDKERINEMFTISSLNQIIFIHGFKRIYKSAKKLLVEAVEAIDPVTPWRSTLGVTPLSASIGKKEIVADLEELEWQECCCVTSVRTLNAKQKSNRKKRKRKLVDLVAAEASLAIGSSSS